MNDLHEVGIYSQKFNDILGISIPCKKILQSDGLIVHLIKHKHTACIPYLQRIPEIIIRPDFIGCNPSIPDSIELVKRYRMNILLAICLDESEDYLYVSSLYSINESKVINRISGGRLKKFE